MSEEKRKEFLTKLASLLDEYNVNIIFTCSSLYSDRIIISERKTEEIILDTFDEWNLSSNAIKKNM